MTAMFTPASSAWRFRNDDGSEAAATWMAAQNVQPAAIPATIPFRLRFRAGDTGGATGTLTPRIYYSRNGGAYAVVGTTTPVKFYDSANIANGVATTTQLTGGGAGAFVAGAVEEDNAAAAVSLGASGNTESEWVLVFDSAQITPGDTFTFQIANGTSLLSSVTATVVAASAPPTQILSPSAIASLEAFGAPTIVQVSDDDLLDEAGFSILDETGGKIQIPRLAVGKARWFDADLKSEDGLDITDENGFTIQMPNNPAQTALAFDGVDRGAGVTGSMAVDMGTTGGGGVAAVSGVGAAAAFTLECKVRLGAISPGGGYIIAGRYSNGGVVGGANPVLYIINQTLRVLIRDNVGGILELVHDLRVIPLLTAFGMYEIATDYDGTTLRLYINGKVVAAQAISGIEAPATTLPFQVGRDQDSGSAGGYPFLGTIDEVRWSNVARYAGTYEPSYLPFTPDANTLGLWHFDENSGNIAMDSSGNNKHGTLIGAVRPAWVTSPWFKSEEWWNGSVWTTQETFISLASSPATVTNWPARQESFDLAVRVMDVNGQPSDNYADVLVGPDRSISGAGAIASGQAFGNPNITGSIVLLPSGIVTAQAFGTPFVNNTQQALSPVAIASAEAFGAVVVAPGPRTLILTGIASAEAMGATVVAPGPVTLVVTGIASAQAMGALGLVLAYFVYPVAIGSGEAFGTPAAVPGPRTVNPTAIASSEAFGAAALSMSITLLPSGIATAQAFGNPTIAIGPISVIASGIASAEAFGLPRATNAITLQVVGIASAGALGVPSLFRTISLIPTGIASAQAFGNTTVVPGSVTLLLTGISSGETFGLVVVIPPSPIWRNVGLIAKGIRLVPGYEIVLIDTEPLMSMVSNGAQMKIINTTGSIRVLQVSEQVTLESDIFVTARG